MRVLAAFLVLVSLALFPTSASSGEDAEGCKDHPLFGRMKNFHLSSCEHEEFNAVSLPLGPICAEAGDSLESAELEGEKYFLEYTINEGAAAASALQIQRNYQNAIKAAGGTVDLDYDSRKKPCDHPQLAGWETVSTSKLTRGGKDVWLMVRAQDGWATYELLVVEVGAMAQEVSVNELAEKLEKEGFLTLYVSFDTGKATIQPDSARTLDDAAAALGAASDLEVEVAGHTDNVGTPETNQALSEARAKAVMAALVERGVAVERLAAKGYGQSQPIADNRTEDGRAKNRRVELVKK